MNQFIAVRTCWQAYDFIDPSSCEHDTDVICWRYWYSLMYCWQYSGSYTSEKTGKSQRIWDVGWRSGKIFFWKSRGEWKSV